jgi:integrase
MTIPSPWLEAISDFISSEQAAGRSPETIATRRYHLYGLAKGVGGSPWRLSGDRLVAWFASKDWATETRRGNRNTARAFYAWAIAAGRVETSPADHLGVVKSGAPNPRPTPDRIYYGAIAAGDRRTRAMLRLAAEAGLRRAEIAQAHSDDLIEDLIGYSLVVHGKGGKDRDVPLPALLATELLLMPAGYFFPGNVDGHLSARWVGTLVSRLLGPGWTCHKLRHRFASRAYAIDRDVFTVQELLGHASPATTRLYVKVAADSKRRTIDAMAA